MHLHTLTVAYMSVHVSENNSRRYPCYVGRCCVLHRLMNQLLASAGMQKIGFRVKANVVFVALSNIEKFTTAAKEYGVPDTSIFEPTDLVEGRKSTLVHVLDCLDRLGQTVSTYHPYSKCIILCRVCRQCRIGHQMRCSYGPRALWAPRSSVR